MRPRKIQASTKIGGEAVSIELVSDELGGVEDHPEPSHGLAHLPVSGGKLIQSLGLSRYRGKPSSAVGSCLKARTLKNFPFHPLNEF